MVAYRGSRDGLQENSCYGAQGHKHGIQRMENLMAYTVVRFQNPVDLMTNLNGPS